MMNTSSLAHAPPLIFCNKKVILVVCVFLAPISVGCTANSDCPSDKACLNKACVDPCDCGPNAQCRVVNHYGICMCPSGYSGNPNLGCYQCKHDCPFVELH